MNTICKIELVIGEVEREDSFPMQEQVIDPLLSGAELPTSMIFAECLANSGIGIAAPVFVP